MRHLHSSPTALVRHTFRRIAPALMLSFIAGCGDDDNPAAPAKSTVSPLSAVAVVQGPLVYNGHTYYRLANSNWSAAETNAIRMLGGNLVSVADAAENGFILTTFANASGSGRVWLGLNDAATEGTFAYSSGQAVAYTNWEPGEPNNAGSGEDYVAMYSGNGRWVDVADLANPPGIGNVYGVVEANTAASIYVVQGPIAYNGHTYYRLNNSNWSDAEAFAVNVLGGHLTSVADAAENGFILTTFANASGSGRVWLGLNDAATEGTFAYSSGQAVAYTNWEPGEPNNAGSGEDYVAMYSGNGRWVDVADLANPPGIGNVYGVVEVE